MIDGRGDAQARQARAAAGVGRHDVVITGGGLAGNAMAGALPFFEAIALAEPAKDADPVSLLLTPSLSLVLVARAIAPPAAAAAAALAS